MSWVCRSMERGDLFNVCDEKPCWKLEDHGFDCLVVVSDVVLL